MDGEEYKVYDVKCGEKVPVEKEPIKEGYIFSGWSEIPKTMPANDVTITGSFSSDYNTDAYKRLTAQIATVQAALDDVKNTINTEYKDVANQFTTQIAGIQMIIDALTADVKKKYDNKALNAESTINTTGVTASIEKLLSDAKAAQKVYDDEQAKIAANEEAYIRLTAQIAAVQTALDDAKTTINRKYNDVVSKFTTRIINIQNRINTLSTDVKTKYYNVTLTVESTIDTASIIASIEQLLSEAREAQEQVDAVKVANEEAYTRLTTQIAMVQAALDEAKNTINTEYKDVADQFTTKIAAIQISINGLTTYVKKKYDNKDLTAESTINTANIEAAIEKLLTDAKAAQKEYEEGLSISSVEENTKVMNIYTLTGKKVTETQKGQIYLFRYENTKTVKRLVK